MLCSNTGGDCLASFKRILTRQGIIDSIKLKILKTDALRGPTLLAHRAAISMGLGGFYCIDFADNQLVRPPKGKDAGLAKVAQPKNTCTSAISRVRLNGGKLCQIFLPYDLVIKRGSQIINTPLSFSSRIKRPAPCFKVITEYGN